MVLEVVPLVAPAIFLLAVFKSATSVQADPFQVSVTFLVPGPPPKAIAAVDVPAPAKPYLAVHKSPTSVQLVPFQDSVTDPGP